MKSTSQFPVGQVAAGRSLGVLTLALATIWLWFQIPGWYAPAPHNDVVMLRMRAYWFQPALLLLLLMVLNVMVLFQATLPLALSSSPGSLLDAPQWPRTLVFWACVVFQVGSCAAIMFLMASWLQL